ncbi:hypothetical protein ACFXPA_46520 [Amycolatopsis sp. NPDC059090]|uniref:hypothetical protein n=1 Tax=unclassified Amycolatopsis TaxID=2618356 RepID=UPI0036709D3D
MTRYTPEEGMRLATAAHEVAHAVACKAAARSTAGRLTVRSARLLAVGGVVEVADVDLDNPEQVETALVVALAEREGSARWVQRNAGLGRGQAIRWASGGCGWDLDYFRANKRLCPRSTGWLQNRARSVVAAHWGRIDRLAHKLADAGRLSGGHFN